jgi:hypothetical protein
VGRKAKKPLPPQGGSSFAPVRTSSTTQGGGLSPREGRSTRRGEKKKNRKPTKKSAAITLTLLPTEEGEDTISMAEVMKRATGRVDLTALNIEYFRPKRSKTGGLILEIPGENSALRADALASKLVEAMRDTKVRISRPIMWAELRVHNLVESATAEEVARVKGKKENM